jgi:hypothetical protein
MNKIYIFMIIFFFSVSFVNSEVESIKTELPQVENIESTLAPTNKIEADSLNNSERSLDVKNKNGGIIAHRVFPSLILLIVIGLFFI